MVMAASRRCDRCTRGRILPDLAGHYQCINCGYEPPADDDREPDQKRAGRVSRWA